MGQGWGSLSTATTRTRRPNRVKPILCADTSIQDVLRDFGARGPPTRGGAPAGLGSGQVAGVETALAARGMASGRCPAAVSEGSASSASRGA
eukprot:12305906-Heterocapsa_arctica.AAC.1